MRKPIDSENAARRISGECMNADWLDLDALDAPDGDADLDAADFSSFNVPSCSSCDGILKPDVEFFSRQVTVAAAADHRHHGLAIGHSRGLLPFLSKALIWPHEPA
ncbi:hypothetical protein DXU04_32700 [Bradyrhizobium diazoefficiens]